MYEGIQRVPSRDPLNETPHFLGTQIRGPRIHSGRVYFGVSEGPRRTPPVSHGVHDGYQGLDGDLYVPYPMVYLPLKGYIKYPLIIPHTTPLMRCLEGDIEVYPDPWRG